MSVFSIVTPLIAHTGRPWLLFVFPFLSISLTLLLLTLYTQFIAFHPERECRKLETKIRNELPSETQASLYSVSVTPGDEPRSCRISVKLSFPPEEAAPERLFAKITQKIVPEIAALKRKRRLTLSAIEIDNKTPSNPGDSYSWKSKDGAAGDYTVRVRVGEDIVRQDVSLGDIPG